MCKVYVKLSPKKTDGHREIFMNIYISDILSIFEEFILNNLCVELNIQTS